MRTLSNLPQEEFDYWIDWLGLGKRK